MRKTPVSGFPRALLSLSHARKRRVLASRLGRPSDGTSGRVARALYHDDALWDLGPEVAFSLSIASLSVTWPLRQTLREKNVGPWTMCDRSLFVCLKAYILGNGILFSSLWYSRVHSGITNEMYAWAFIRLHLRSVTVVWLKHHLDFKPFDRRQILLAQNGIN